jgi:Glycosyl hydrolases family 16/PA14 domain
VPTRTRSPKHAASASRGGRHAARPRRRVRLVAVVALLVVAGVTSTQALSDDSPPPSRSSAGDPSPVAAGRVAAPQATAATSHPVHGLGVTYYDNPDLTGRSFSGIDRNVNFNWGLGSPAALIGPDTFSARWTGKVLPTVSGIHTFHADGDDGVRLWVDGRQLVDDWALRPATGRSGSIALTAGQPYEIRMEFFDRDGPAVAKLLWSGPGMPRAPVPSTQLYPTGVGNDVRVRSLSAAAAPYPVGARVTVATRLSAPVATALSRLVIRVRLKGDDAGFDLPFKRDVRVDASARTFRFSGAFPSPGTYVYWAALYRDGSWVNLLPQRELTIERATPPPPPSTRAVTPKDGDDDIAAPSGGPWKLAFHDEFADGALDTGKWSIRYPRSGAMCCSNQGNGEAQWYLPRNVVEQDGELHLVARREGVNGFGYSSGLIQSKPSFSFTYGFAEARMRLPEGSGFWPAFWTWPQNEQWPPEIDAFEFYGDNVRNVYLTYHAPGGADQSIVTRPDWTSDWHTFAIDWRPGSIRWYIDGTQVKARSSADVSDIPMYLIANLAIADGSNAPAPTSQTPLPSRLRIDWIRVWKPA